MHQAGTFLLFSLAVVIAPVNAGQGAAYDLSHPARHYTLPAELLEISGITDVDANTIACLQDEAAMLYFIDLVSGSISRRLTFGVPGDYEGLTRVGELYFALRSDGLIHRLRLRDGAIELLDTFRLAIPNHNIEGLGYDEAKDRVLVSPKDFAKGDKTARDERVIHAFDPVTGKMAAEPALRFSVSGIIAQAEAIGVRLPMRKTDNGRELPALKLRLSSVAVHPTMDHYYLLSAVDHVLLILDRNARLVALHVLDPVAFPKPEGITFLPGGDMLISNEGKGGQPNLLRFHVQ